MTLYVPTAAMRSAISAPAIMLRAVAVCGDRAPATTCAIGATSPPARRGSRAVMTRCAGSASDAGSAPVRNVRTMSRAGHCAAGT